MPRRLIILFAAASTAIVAPGACKPKAVEVATPLEKPSRCEQWSAQFARAFAREIEPKPHPDTSPSTEAFYRYVGDPANYYPEYSEELEDCCFFSRSLKVPPKDAGFAMADGDFSECLDKDTGMFIRTRRQ